MIPCTFEVTHEDGNKSLHQVVIDPNDEYTQHDPRTMLDWCGLIPRFINPQDIQWLWDQAIHSYPYYNGEVSGFTSNDKFMLLYEGDPSLHPLVKWEREVNDKPEVFCVYEYGYVAWFYNGEMKVTRMD